MTVPPPAAHPARRDHLPLWVIVLLGLFLLMRVVEVAQLGQDTSASGTDSMTDLLQTDLQAKAAFLSDTKALAGARQGIVVRPDVKSLRAALKSALALQKETANSPAAARRVMLLRFLLLHYDGQGQNAVPPLAADAKIDPLAAFGTALPPETPAADKATYAAEAKLWQTVFDGGHLSPKQIADADAQLRALPRLRWWKNVARMALYAGQGDASEAARLARQAQSDALPPLLGFGAAGLARLGAAGAGLLLLIYFGARRLQKASTPDTVWPTVPAPVADSERKLGAGDLFAVFVVYLLTREVLSLLLSGVHIPRVLFWPGLLEPLRAHLLTLSASERATRGIVLEAVVYVVSAVPALVYLWGMARQRGASLANEIGWTRRSLGVNLLYGVGGFGVATVLMLTVAFAGTRLLRNLPAPSNPVIPQIANASGVGVVLLLVLLVSVAAPFVEELLFRGVLYQAARQKLGVWPAIALTGAVFGFVHPEGVAGMLAIAMLGGTFAWMAETRKSLVPSIFAHGINNLLTALTLLLVVNG